MIAMGTEKMSTVRQEIEPLLRQHYEEIALHKDRIPLAPDWGRYEHLEATRSLPIYTARSDGKLVGYSVFLLSYHLHYRNTLVAANDILYLAPEQRRGTTGLRLIKHSEAELKKLGVERIMWHVKFAHDFRAILHRLGYEDEEAIVGKLI